MYKNKLKDFRNKGKSYPRWEGDTCAPRWEKRKPVDEDLEDRFVLRVEVDSRPRPYHAG